MRDLHECSRLEEIVLVARGLDTCKGDLVFTKPRTMPESPEFRRLLGRRNDGDQGIEQEELETALQEYPRKHKPRMMQARNELLLGLSQLLCEKSDQLGRWTNTLF